MLMRTLQGLSVLVLATACGGPEIAEPEEAPVAGVRGAAELVMSPEGAASLRGPTPFTLAAVEAAFPGFSVIPVTDPESGSVTFEVRPEGRDTARFLVESDWSRGNVAIVSSRDPAVRGPAGEVIGKTTLGAIGPDARALCTPGEPGLLICPDPAAPAAFARVYALGPEDAPESEAVLAELRLYVEQP